MRGSSAPIRNTKKGNKPWQLDLRYLGGNREFFESEDLAKGRRSTVLAEIRREGTEAFRLSLDERTDFVRAKKRLEKYGVSISEAVAFYENHHEVQEPILFSEAIDIAYEVKKASKKDPEYVRKFKSTLTSLKDACGNRVLSTINRKEIEAWLFGSGWKQDTIRNKRTDVRTFFSFAHRRHWIAVNPAESLESVAATDKPPGILTPEECACLLNAALAEMPTFLTYVILSLFCGIRPEEVVKLLPENIRPEQGWVEVPAFRGDEPIAKSRKRRLVQLSPNAVEWLKRATYQNIDTKNPKWYARQIAKLRTPASRLLGRPFPWPKNCLRHSFASYHLAMHGSADKTATQMGHRSTDTLFRHYRELVTKQDAEKFWGILPL